MKGKKGIEKTINELKEERSLKLKMIKAIDMIEEELKKRKLKFSVDGGVFEVNVKSKKFSFQIDDGETINSCWIDISKYKSFELCEYYITIDEFICQLDDIILDLDKFYKLKQKVEKHINEIEKLIVNSDIHGLHMNEYTFDDMLFENIISTTDN